MIEIYLLIFIVIIFAFALAYAVRKTRNLAIEGKLETARLVRELVTHRLLKDDDNQQTDMSIRESAREASL